MAEPRAGAVSSALVQQGYAYSPERLRELSWALRFTPTVCMAAALVGLATRQPAIHFVLAALGTLSFRLPKAHPVDLLYNHVLSPLWGGVKLPPNPLPRRIACFMGGAMNLGIAFAFVGGIVPLAYVLGGTLIVLQLIVTTTHFCVVSWMYEMLLRALGQWVPIIPLTEARALLAAGAELIDVREPDEFAGGHLPRSRNVPLAGVVEGLADVRDRPLLLYCVSGMRSQRAIRMLMRAGFEQVHNLGAMERMQGDRA